MLLRVAELVGGPGVATRVSAFSSSLQESGAVSLGSIAPFHIVGKLTNATETFC